jgi:glycosyltransferase involved in cell wall biosynthesis
MKALPYFSVVIPTYNRPARLEACLKSLVRLDYPRDRFEVVVVDDGSETSLQPIVNLFSQDLTINFIRQTNAGPASARNTGAAAAHGEYLVFTDDDCQPLPTWLATLAKAVNDSPKALVGGHTINALPNNIYSSASQYLIDYLYDYYNRAQGKATFFASNNFAMPRVLYQQLNGFDTSFPLAAGEDREFCDRWQNCGYELVYVPEAQIYHAHHLSLASFWRQHFNYGRGAFCFHQARSHRSHEPIQVEPFSFYFGLLAYPLTRRSGWKSPLLSVLFLVSQVANVLGFLYEKQEQTRTPMQTSVSP